MSKCQGSTFLSRLSCPTLAVNEIGPRVLEHRVIRYILCPLGEPEITIGPEPRIEPSLP